MEKPVILSVIKKPPLRWLFMIAWLRGQDLNLGPLGYEPNELPDCSTPRYLRNYRDRAIMSQANAPLKQQYAKVSCVIKRFAASML